MTTRNTELIVILAAFVMIFGFAQQTKAQLGSNDSSTNYLALQIAASAGASSENYQEYAEKLARTVSHLDTTQQATVFGFTPSPSGPVQAVSNPSSSGLPQPSGNGAVTSSGSPGSNTQSQTSSSRQPSSWWQDILASIRGYFLSGDGNNGHGNDAGGVDPGNPGQGRGRP